MKRFRGSAACLLALALLAGTAYGQADQVTLEQKAKKADQELFDAYNACDLDKFASLFSPDVEFYHDTGGVTRSREEVVANTRKYICGKVRRELVGGTLEVFPIKGFGAISTGEHRFCELASGRCEGIARFTIVWQETNGAWVAVRVLSYGHRAATR